MSDFGLLEAIVVAVICITGVVSAAVFALLALGRLGQRAWPVGERQTTDQHAGTPAR